MNWTKHAISAMATTLGVLGLAASAQANEDAQDFFDDCGGFVPIFVGSNTTVEGDASVPGDCEIVLLPDVTLTLHDVELDVMGYLKVIGGPESDFDVINSDIWAMGVAALFPEDIKVKNSDIETDFFTVLISIGEDSSVEVKNSDMVSGSKVIVLSLAEGEANSEVDGSDIETLGTFNENCDIEIMAAEIDGLVAFDGNPGAAGKVIVAAAALAAAETDIDDTVVIAHGLGNDMTEVTDEVCVEVATQVEAQKLEGEWGEELDGRLRSVSLILAISAAFGEAETTLNDADLYTHGIVAAAALALLEAEVVAKNDSELDGYLTLVIALALGGATVDVFDSELYAGHLIGVASLGGAYAQTHVEDSDLDLADVNGNGDVNGLTNSNGNGGLTLVLSLSFEDATTLSEGNDYEGGSKVAIGSISGDDALTDALDNDFENVGEVKIFALGDDPDCSSWSNDPDQECFEIAI